MTNTFHVGIAHSVSLTVDDRLTVPAVSAAFTGFADMPPVFATAYMVGFVEWACIDRHGGKLLWKPMPTILNVGRDERDSCSQRAVLLRGLSHPIT